MKSLIRLTDYNVNDIYDIFKLTDEIRKGKHQDFLKGKSVVLFFPNTSIRTRVTFEKGIYLLGGQSILFPADTLDKKEDLRDVCGYLNNWADMVIVRHKDICLLQNMADCLKIPVINAMTDGNQKISSGCSTGNYDVLFDLTNRKLWRRKMSTYILTSMFPNGFNDKSPLQKRIWFG